MVNDNLNFENARLIFKNFAGEKTKYNAAGNRNFSVIIDNPEDAIMFKADGWNVREMPSRDPDEGPTYFLTVKVAYNDYPPNVYLVTSKKRTLLDEYTIDMLDQVEIANVDLIVRPYNYEVNGRTGVAAYLHTMYVTIRENPFAAKYEHLDSDGDPF